MNGLPREEAVQILLAASRDFYSRGWMPGTSGNLSLRLEPLTFLVTASGKDKGALGPADFLVVNQRGELLEPTSQRPSAETPIHRRLYSSFAVGAVYHVHALSSVIISRRYRSEGKVVIRELEILKGLEGVAADEVIEIPVLANDPHIPALAEAIVAAARPNVPGVLIDGHGLYAWGASAFTAKRHLEVLEYLCQYLVLAGG
ncbi:MAG: methylthioribulose 1-phosphate dehydratase [Deinococcus sp.]|nr:methylthioribulose 1-phosphate dehydratase [Deinococcus sp.]